MNRSADKFWRSTSLRKFFSLSITVIWLTAMLQPCVMASVAAFDYADSHHSGDMVDQHPHAGSRDDKEPVCPHCKSGNGVDGECGSVSDVVCEGDSSYVYFSRIKPLDDDQFFKQSQPFVPGRTDTREPETVSLTVSFQGASLRLPAGPPLRDLYRVYLK